MKFMAHLVLAVLVLATSGCSMIWDKEVEYAYVEPPSYPVLTAVGFAPIPQQQGSDFNTKMLRAMKASKLEAYRELAEQVYGQRIQGQGTVADMVMGQEVLKTKVDGVVRGAKVVKSYQVGDNYVTEMELDMEQVNLLVWGQNQPRTVKQVHYY